MNPIGPGLFDPIETCTVAGLNGKCDNHPHFPRSRTTDPQTSKEAGTSMAQEAQVQREAILSYLRQHPGGMCADRLDEALGFRDGRAGKRCPELCEQGLAVLCDGAEKQIGGVTYMVPELRQQTRSKRWGCLVVAVEHLDPSWKL